MIWIVGTASILFEDIWDPYFQSRGLYFSAEGEGVRTKIQAEAIAELERRKAARDPRLRLYNLTSPDGNVHPIAAENEEAASELLKDRIGNWLINPGDSSDSVASPLAVEMFSDKYRSFEQAWIAGYFQRVEFETISEVVLFLPVGLPEGEVSRRTKVAHDTAVRLKDTVVSQRRSEATKTAALMALIPPIALFLIGAGIGWSLSGFRSNT
ncbi:MAG: hypothetical protein Q8K28_09525 [Hoeflea sp.]|uniref:hypothetical protein n=1 Tax=Hoeflea sp. TaxID=1940281 RepID=UPI00273156EA|nr:hypothetical protein [Hoeflea sp.]MDP2120130.1 hypothetical protein [Hoeflea sp.]